MTIIYCVRCGGVKHSDMVMNKFTVPCSCEEQAISDSNNLKGWECPRCHKIHSPFSLQCDCPPKVETKNTMDTQINENYQLIDK